MIFLSKILCLGVAITAANTILQPYHLFMLQQPNSPTYMNKLAFTPIPLFTHNLKKEFDVSMLNNLQMDITRKRKLENIHKDWNFNERKMNDAQFGSEGLCTTRQCPGPNTLCIGTSSFERACICRENYFPINGNAALFGCKSRVGLLPRFSTFFNAKECSDIACGPNAYCMKNHCVCAPRYFQIGLTVSAQGCRDPCFDTKCYGNHAVCIGLSSTEAKCICSGSKVPIQGNAKEFGCEKACQSSACGSNAHCELNRCTCNARFFAMSTRSNNLRCVDPCITKPCNKKKTACIGISATERLCLCLGTTIPIEKNAAENGCGEDPCTDSNPCMNSTNTACFPLSGTQTTCVCTGKNVPVNGSASMNGCVVQSDCNTKSCGANSYCILRDGIPTCVCVNEYFVASGEDIDVNGCKNPCEPNPCSLVQNAKCLSLTATKFDCICPYGTKLSDGVNPDNECVPGNRCFCKCIEGFIPASCNSMNAGCVPELECIEVDCTTFTETRIDCGNSPGRILSSNYDNICMDFIIRRSNCEQIQITVADLKVNPFFQMIIYDGDASNDEDEIGSIFRNTSVGTQFTTTGSAMYLFYTIDSEGIGGDYDIAYNRIKPSFFIG